MAVSHRVGGHRPRPPEGCNQRRVGGNRHCSHRPQKGNTEGNVLFNNMTGVTKAVVYIILTGMMHIKEPLLLIGKSSLCGSSRFPLSYLSGPLSYV